MPYKLIARDKVFCEGTLSECQKTLTGISKMIHAGFSTNFEIDEFMISNANANENKTTWKQYDF